MTHSDGLPAFREERARLGDRSSRARLRARLQAEYPWLGSSTWGPAVVEAGECDRCGVEARMIPTCGPDAPAFLGRGCLEGFGPDAFCEGHQDQLRAALTYVGALPREADDVARLWWLSTGEVRLEPEGGEGLSERP